MGKPNLAKNYIYNIIYQVMIIFLPLITTPYISRVLGAENIGIYSYTQAISNYFIIFGVLGIGIYGQREIAYVQNDIKRYSQSFWELFLLKTITVSIALAIFYICFALRESEYQLFYQLLMLEIVGNIFDISWFFQGLEDFKKIVIRNAFAKLISVICVFVFVKTPQDLYKYFIIYVLSVLVGNLSVWMYLPRVICKVKVKTLKIFRHFFPTIALFVPQIAIQIYTLLDKVMLGTIIESKTEVGYYEQSQKIIRILLALVTAMGTVLMPRIANLYASGNKEGIERHIKTSFRVVFALAFPIIFGLISISDVFVPLFFGAGYDRVSVLIKVISPVILFIGMSNVVGIQYLLPVKRQKEYTVSVWCGAIINAIFNAIFIPKFGALGAAIGTVIAELCVVLVQLFFVRKSFDLKGITLSATKYLLGSVIMYAIISLICIFMRDFTPILSLLVSVGVGASVYFVFLFIMKDELIRSIVSKFIGIFKKA